MTATPRQPQQYDPEAKANGERERMSKGISQIARNAKGSLANRSLLLAFGLVVIDLLAVSHYQLSTTYALIQHTAPFGIPSGVLLTLGPWLIQVTIIYQVLVGAKIATRSGDGLIERLGVVGGAIFVSMYFVDKDESLSVWQSLLGRRLRADHRGRQ